MRVLVCALPAYGHLYPVMPLAEALRAAGHEVVLATGPGAAERLRGAGWDVELVDATTNGAAGQLIASGTTPMSFPPPERWKFAVAMFADVLAGQVSRQLAPILAARRPDLVVYEEMNVGAAVAAGLAGVPAVRHGLGPWLLPPMQEGFLAATAAHWEAAGATPPQGGELFGRLHLDIWPPELATPRAPMPLPHVPLQPVAWDDAPQGPPSWLLDAAAARTRPVVYLTLGTVSTGEVDVLRAVLEGLAPLDVDVLAAVGSQLDRSALGELSPRVHLESFVPGARVFGLVDVVIHHGGAGTVLGALAGGLPQLVLPQQAHDQFLSAMALSSGGAGTALMGGQVSADAVTQAVEPLLGAGSARERAAGIAGTIAGMPTPKEVVPELEALVA